MTSSPPPVPVRSPDRNSSYGTFAYAQHEPQEVPERIRQFYHLPDPNHQPDSATPPPIRLDRDDRGDQVPLTQYHRRDSFQRGPPTSQPQGGRERWNFSYVHRQQPSYSSSSNATKKDDESQSRSSGGSFESPYGPRDSGGANSSYPTLIGIWTNSEHGESMQSVARSSEDTSRADGSEGGGSSHGSSEQSKPSTLKKLRPMKSKKHVNQDSPLHIERKVSFDQQSAHFSTPEDSEKGLEEWKASDYDTSGLSVEQIHKLKKKGINPALYAEMQSAKKAKGGRWISPLVGNTYIA